jgi:hypothetical protein
MFCMTEHEKALQIGHLAEEYSNLKGELNHLEEKVGRVGRAYAFMGTGATFQNINVQLGALILLNAQSRGQVAHDFADLLNQRELVELFTERNRVREEVQRVGERLKALTPHLL